MPHPAGHCAHVIGQRAAVTCGRRIHHPRSPSEPRTRQDSRDETEDKRTHQIKRNAMRKSEQNKPDGRWEQCPVPVPVRAVASACGRKRQQRADPGRSPLSQMKKSHAVRHSHLIAPFVTANANRATALTSNHPPLTCDATTPPIRAPSKPWYMHPLFDWYPPRLASCSTKNCRLQTTSRLHRHVHHSFAHGLSSHSTVTDFARLRGWSTLHRRISAM